MLILVFFQVQWSIEVLIEILHCLTFPAPQCAFRLRLFFYPPGRAAQGLCLRLPWRHCLPHDAGALWLERDAVALALVVALILLLDVNLLCLTVAMLSSTAAAASSD